MSNGHDSFIGSCEFCGAHFTAHSLRAKFCSAAHRQAAHRAKKKGDGRTWHDVAEIYKIHATDVRTLSPQAFDLIHKLLSEFGARAAIMAIEAAYESSNIAFSLGAQNE